MATLFIDNDKKEWTSQDVKNVLVKVGTHDCDALFIHSDISFGMLAQGIKRGQYLGELKNCFDELNVKNLVVPTFTYSFCNNENYDVRNTKTSMGAFSEFLRNQEGYYRTLDPLLSLSVPESMEENYLNLSEHSLGKDSGLDRFHCTNGGGYKFLFFGASMSDCFTYLHYVEKIKNVPYRFDMKFKGKVIDYEGNEIEKIAFIHTQCGGVKLAEDGRFEKELVQSGLLKKARLGNLTVACISEKDAYGQIVNKLDTNINYFLEHPFTEVELEHRYTMGLNGKRITHC